MFTLVFFLQRPWHDVRVSYQIMYLVGSGQTPAIPESLSHEGKSFLRQCLVFDPEKRPNCSDLLYHSFLKVTSRKKLFLKKHVRVHVHFNYCFRFSMIWKKT